jgi:hypothetical protein
MENSTNVEAKSEGSEQFNIDDVLKERDALKLQNERLLDESKTYKKKWQSVNGEKSAIERERLEKEGNFQALLEAEQKRTLELEGKLKDREKNLLKTQARSLLSELAKDAHDVGDLLRLDEVSMIQYDEENLSVVKDSVNKFVATVRDKKPWMFGEKKIPSQADGKPTQSSKKSVGNMTEAERLQEMKNSFKSIF